MSQITTFIIPSINRPTLARAMDSVLKAGGIYSVHIDSERKGAGLVRNQLIREAKTEYVSFLDDDDSICPDYLERLEEELAAHPDADIIYFRAYWADSGILLPAWPNMGFGVGVFFTIKRELALKYPFRTEPSEDQEFIKRLMDAGANIHWSKYICYRVRH